MSNLKVLVKPTDSLVDFVGNSSCYGVMVEATAAA